ncbi:MAG: zinc-binding protein, partial [Thermoplasmata archaeon]|nr:zinc-binding protein [Thermoplasmata archaeon]
MAKRIIAIDGCPVICARKTLEHAGFNVNTNIIVTELGITKSPELDIKDEDVKVIINHVE